MALYGFPDFSVGSVQQFKHANQFLIKGYIHTKNAGSTWVGRYVAFQSYDTLIAVYDINTQELYISQDNWDYSKTTMKHLKDFINEMTCYTYETKQGFMKFIYHCDKVYLY